MRRLDITSMSAKHRLSACIRALLPCLLIGLHAHATDALRTTGDIRIIVEDSEGSPLIGAAVMIVGTSMGAMTDAAGLAAISDLQPGDYDLRVQMVGMTTAELSVTVEPGETVNETVSLASQFIYAPPTWHRPDTVFMTAQSLRLVPDSALQGITASGDTRGLRIRLSNPPPSFMTCRDEISRIAIPLPLDVRSGGIFLIDQSGRPWRVLHVGANPPYTALRTGPLFLEPETEAGTDPYMDHPTGDFDGNGDDESPSEAALSEAIELLSTWVPSSPSEGIPRHSTMRLDADGDSRDELICIYRRGLYHLSMQGVTGWVVLRVSPADSSWVPIAIADLDSDGRDEVIAYTTGDAECRGLVLRLDRDGWQVSGRFSLEPHDESYWEYSLVDFDRDGSEEVLQSDRRGSFLCEIDKISSCPPHLAGLNGPAAGSAVSCDLDSDGMMEILAMREDSLFCWVPAFQPEGMLVFGPVTGGGLVFDGSLLIDWHQEGDSVRDCTDVSISWRTRGQGMAEAGSWSEWIDVPIDQGCPATFDDFRSIELRVRLRTDDPTCTPVITRLGMAREFPVPPGVDPDAPYIVIPI
jgi:hypothetical protein